MRKWRHRSVKYKYTIHTNYKNYNQTTMNMLWGCGLDCRVSFIFRLVVKPRINRTCIIIWCREMSADFLTFRLIVRQFGAICRIFSVNHWLLDIIYQSVLIISQRLVLRQRTPQLAMGGSQSFGLYDICFHEWQNFQRMYTD